MVKLLEPELAPILNGSVSADEAIEASRYQLKQSNPDPRWCIPWAYVLWQQEAFSEAYALAAEYHSSLQNDGDFLLLFGMIARQIPDRLPEAEAAFQAAIRLQPHRHDAYYNLGNLVFAQEVYGRHT